MVPRRPEQALRFTREETDRARYRRTLAAFRRAPRARTARARRDFRQAGPAPAGMRLSAAHATLAFDAALRDLRGIGRIDVRPTPADHIHRQVENLSAL